MSAGIDQIRTREPGAEIGESRSTETLADDDTRLVRVDVSGVPLADVRSIVRERGSTQVYVEHRAGSTYLVGDRDRPIA